MKAMFVAALAICLSGAVEARTVTLTTVTFNDPFLAPPPGAINPNITWDGMGSNEYQDGYTYQTSTVYTHAPIGLTDDSGLVTSTLQRIDGGRFSLSSFDVLAYNNSAYVTGSGPQPTDPNDYNTWIMDHLSAEMGWMIEGYRDGNVVSSFFMAATSTYAYSNMSFGNLFQNLDSIVFSMVFPTGFVYSDDGSGLGPNTSWCLSYYCAEISFNNIVVSNVPLPAGLPMLAAGLGLLWTIRRKALRGKDA